ncbi:hypothetical protein PoB_006774200 [Plakobranchus ocellatus]|uniref:Uncharacterized protein n=1 Tax=Plakobranchus ocellatus TaxID=259542 RepID=A0AAV4DAF3_9GAST|nr:hypothetical protein PoB_006774200 [Plakobranchus ocellatus]
MNKEKCRFRQKKVKYFGHRFSEVGIEPDSAKGNTIKDMPPPQNQAELRTRLEKLKSETVHDIELPQMISYVCSWWSKSISTQLKAKQKAQGKLSLIYGLQVLS